MKLLAIGRPRDGLDARSEIARHARGQMRAPWQLYRDSVVREMYSPGGPGSVLVLEVPPQHDAGAVLAGLPLVASKVIGFEFIELHPFSAFELLSAGGERSARPEDRRTS